MQTPSLQKLQHRWILVAGHRVLEPWAFGLGVPGEAPSQSIGNVTPKAALAAQANARYISIYLDMLVRGRADRVMGRLGVWSSFRRRRHVPRLPRL